MKVVLLFLWHLSICLQAQARELPPPPAYNEQLDRGSHGLYPTRSYVTEKDIRSPILNYVTWNPECDDGLYTFLTPRGHSLPQDPGPAIFDGRGELVWYHHYHNAWGGEAYNALVQKYNGEDHLTFWLGDDRVRGHGAGFYYLVGASSKYERKVLTSDDSLIRITKLYRKLAQRMA